ncbi:unnamed protein product [Periconia digitata]|uniref:DUF6604 domain-containing protein n=1 Tax=Periconia digitata TaxID=1303443 RepID=A0A9W4XGW7_9PLEO|nr:unnamed protein product [Periconia digitata]
MSSKKKKSATPNPSSAAKNSPPLVYDSYKRYKSDTQRLIAWLVKVGKDSGYPSPIKTCTNDLRQLAKNVSTHAASILPASILAIGRRAVSLRKKVTEAFMSRGPSRSNKKHAYFVQVLEEILDMFKTPSDDEQKKQNSANDKSWLNSFAALAVEEFEELSDGDAGVDLPEAAKITKALDDENSEHDSDDVLSRGLFQLLCLFYDLQQWRSFIAETWAEYARSEIDLTTATVVTDQALKFGRELIQSTKDRLPKPLPETDIELQGMLMNYMIQTCGVDSPVPWPGIVPYHVKNAGLADYCFLPSGILVSSFANQIEKGTISRYNQGFFGTYNPEANRANMTVTEKFKEDKILILELLPEYFTIGMSKIPLPIWDETTLAFTDLADTRKHTMWLSFVAQVLLDSIHATRYMSKQPFSDLRITAARIRRTIDDFWELSKTHPPPKFWPAEGDQIIKAIREDIAGFIDKDAYIPIKKALAHSTDKKDRSPDFYIFIRNPGLCGAFAFNLQLRMQTIGQDLLNQWFDVQQLAFLYSLVNETPGYENLSWPDMELFIKIHGEDHIFMGSRPRNAEQALHRVEMLTGASSATRFAKDSRHAKSEWHVPDGKSGRRLTPTTKTADLMRPYYCMKRIGATPRQSINDTALSRYLNELLEKTEATSTKSSSSKSEIKQTGAHKVSSVQQFVGRKWRNQHSLGFVQLLTLLKTQLSEEEPYLQFNYFAMHRRSVELLRLIRDKEHHKFVQYFTEAYLPDESFVTNIVIYILHVARGSAKAGNDLGLANVAQGSKVASRMVGSCGEVMKTYLEKNGSLMLKELKLFCRNKAPLELHSTKITENGDSSQRQYYWLGMDEVLSPAQLEVLRTGISLA